MPRYITSSPATANNTIKDSAIQDAAREKIAQLTAVFLAQGGEIEEPEYDEKKIKEDLAAKYRPLLAKRQTFDFDSNKKRKKK